MDGQIICHCVREDCSNCPMRETGTSGILAEWHFFHKHEEKDNFNNNKED